MVIFNYVTSNIQLIFVKFSTVLMVIIDCPSIHHIMVNDFFSLSYPTHVLEWGRPLFGNAYDRLHITFASTPAFDAQKQAKNWKMRTMKTTRKVP